MSISIYTYVKDGIVNDFHVEAMLRHHLPLADEIIVNEGFSKDDTYNRISKIDPKIKIYRTDWGKPKGIDWWVQFKDFARRKCCSDWCILLDCDEFIPEWEFLEIKNFLNKTKEVLIPVELINFYGNYKIFHSNPEKVSWPKYKVIIHRNLDEIEIWGDGSNVRHKIIEYNLKSAKRFFSVHHFGMVRNPGILRYKWWIQGRAFMGKLGAILPPIFIFKLFPHDWLDSAFYSDLKIYEGKEILAVKKDPNEFIRDDMMLFKKLKK